MSEFVRELSSLRESMRMAFSAIRASKLRSILTLLGIIVGIFSIIGTMTGVSVLRNSIEEGLTQLGANTFQLQRRGNDFNTTPEEQRRMRMRKHITYEQAFAIHEKMTLAEAVGIEAWKFGRIVFSEGGEKTNPSVSIGGENVEGIVTNDWSVDVGRSLSAQDLDLSRNVVILGQMVAEKLFRPSVNPVGQTVRFDGRLYQVIGVFAKKGSALGGNQDNMVIIPLTTWFAQYGKEDAEIHIMVKAKSREVFTEAIEQARMILRVARNVTPGAEDDFSYFSNDSLIEQFDGFTLYFRVGMLVIASIALLAAGVGIMNIMLVSVTERTREIGIRKAIGATRRAILWQFIIEAVTLSQVGGILGIILGIFGGNVVGILLEVPAVIPWDWVAIGLIVCSMVGLLFGVYPAWKAAALDPIEALRYE